MTLWWLSFCDPTGEQFLGAVIAEAPDLAEAITLTWQKGCNPGGQVLGVEIPADLAAAHPAVLVAPRYVLMDWAQMMDLGLKPTRAGDAET